MNLLQNLLHTVFFKLEGVKAKYPELTIQHGLPASAPSGLAVALEYDKSKVDTQHELAGFRRHPRVFFADVYSADLVKRNGLCEEIKDLFENKTLPVLDASKQDTGIMMIGEGVRIEVDHTQEGKKARAKIYVYTLV